MDKKLNWENQEALRACLVIAAEIITAKGFEQAGNTFVESLLNVRSITLRIMKGIISYLSGDTDERPGGLTASAFFTAVQDSFPRQEIIANNLHDQARDFLTGIFNAELRNLDEKALGLLNSDNRTPQPNHPIPAYRIPTGGMTQEQVRQHYTTNATNNINWQEEN